MDGKCSPGISRNASPPSSGTFERGVVELDNLRGIAERIDLAVARELTRAEQLAEQGFYSEAGLRLGRAIEAGLYSIARELNIDLTN